MLEISLHFDRLHVLANVRFLCSLQKEPNWVDSAGSGSNREQMRADRLVIRGALEVLGEDAAATVPYCPGRSENAKEAAFNDLQTYCFVWTYNLKLLSFSH